MKINIENILAYLAGKEKISGHPLIGTFLQEQNKFKKVDARYTEKIGEKLQQCERCDHFIPAGKNCANCEKVQGAIWCLAHCKFWVMTGGRQKLHP